MSGAHRHFRRTGSSESWSSSGRRSTSRSSMWPSTTETDDDVHGGGGRRLKRSSAPASHHSWVLLNRTGARRDEFHACDRTTSAMSRISRGEEISVSFEFLEPPNTCNLTADLPPALTPPTIIAAHCDVVLLAITANVVDLFVYQASRLPSLLLLPSAGGPVIYSHRMDMMGMGIMSCTSNNDDDSSPPFVVAHLGMRSGGVAAATADAHLFRSGSGQWEVFENLQLHGANDGVGRESSLLCWWITDEVVRYGRRYMIWVDYFRGMVIMDLKSQSSETTNPSSPPRLQYVRLPVDRVADPEHNDFVGNGRCPKASRSVCVTRYGIKFVSVDRQHISNFGIGELHTLTWSYRFRITTWSLCEDDYTWRNDVRMHEEKFWGTFDGGDRFPFPHVQPQFPVVDVDNPDIVVFQLEEPWASGQKWMIEVDLRKKVLLAATDYSKKKSDDAEDINLVTWKSGFDDPIPSELPRYLDCGEACKKRRQ